MKTLSIKVKLINCFFALTLVTGLCVPSIASYAYAEPVIDTEASNVSAQVENHIETEEVKSGNTNTETKNASEAVKQESLNTETNDGQDNLTEEIAAKTQSEEIVSLSTEVTDWTEVAGSGFQVKSANNAPLTISDKVGEGVDCYFSGNILHVSSSHPIGIRNNPSNATTTNTIQIDPGVQAEVTLAGVNIKVGSKESNAPINIVRSATATTSLYLTLADNSDNTLDATANQAATGTPAIRCGRGTKLTIDDSIKNIDSATNEHVLLKNGQIGAHATLVGGQVVEVGQPISVLDSDSKHTLVAKGGGYSAAIGGGPREDSGNITINGGEIKAIGVGLKNEVTAEGTAGDYAAGAGIGGGSHGSGTDITINSGNITSYAAWHGAGIGSGWGNTVNGTKKTDALYADSLNTDGTERVKPQGGNITINGGMIRSYGAGHGNAFGQGCGANNNGKTILITGGTLLCTAPTATDLTTYMSDIGGLGGYVVITGGSVGFTKPLWGRLTTAKNKIAFQGNDDDGKAWGKDWVQTDPDTHKETNKVAPITIDLAADLLGGTTVPTEENRKTLSNQIKAWELHVGNAHYDYGAPNCFDRGQLYLWLPEQAINDSTVSVNFSYLGKDNDGNDAIITPEELYREPGQSGTNLKTYIQFAIPPSFFTEGDSSTYKLPEGIKLPTMYQPDNDDGIVHTITKPYDGLPFGIQDISQLTGEDRIITTDNKVLSDPTAVDYRYQVLNLKKNELEPEQTSGTEMPRNTGIMAFTMVSKEYADPNSTDPVKQSFSASNWGHRATGWCQIHEVPAVVNLHSAEWGTLTKDENNKWNWKETKESDPEPGNRIKLHFDIRSALGTAVTCGVPTGSFQVLVDDKEVGNPIPLTDEAIKAEDNNKLTKYESKFKDQRAANTEENNTNKALLGDRAKTDVVYYLDPTRIDGLLDVLESEAMPKIQSEIQAMAESSNSIEGVNKNSHKVTIKYLPDINYFEGTEEGYEEAATKPTTIIPVKNEPEVKDETGGEIKFDEKYETSLLKNYSDFHKRNIDGTPVDGIDPYFKLAIKSKSASPVTWTTSDPTVADVMRYAEDDPKGAYKAGDVIYEESQDGELIPRIEVKSCGYTTITMSQGSNAFFNGQKRTIHLTVIPDATIVPTTEVRVVWENTTNPGFPAAPGDVLEYTVIGSNLTEGSSWQEVVLGDEFDKDLEFVPNSVKLAKNFASPENLDALTSESLKGIEFGDLASNKYTVANNEITLNKDIVNSIYGGQSSAFKFQVKVKDNLTDRKAVTGENPPKIPNTPTVDGGSGIVETADLVPGQDRGKYQNLKDGDNPTKVYPIESDEIPEAVVIPKDPKLPGDPSGDNRSDISVVKTAKNLTHPEGNKALVGDTIEYSITVENKGKDSCYYWPVIKDTLPTGLAPVAGSFELTKVDGSKVSVPDSAYQKATNTISLYVDDLYGNEKTTLTFKCTVTPEATDIANTAQVIGTTPSEKWKGEHPDPIVDPADDPKLSYIKFDANEGKGAPEGIKGETSSAITTAFPTTEPTREGYEFVGWNTQIDGTGLGIKAYPSKFLSNPGSIYYYAQWKKVTTDDPGKEPGDPKPADPTQYSYILFAANGGKNAPEGIKGEPGSAVTDKFPTAKPTAPEGYEFVGWFDNKDAGNKVEKYPDTFPAVTDADNVKPSTIIYYAHWNKVNPDAPDFEVTDPVNPLGLAYIKFDANGGQFVTPVVAQADTATAPVWSTAGLSGTPKAAISDADKNTFPLKEYGPVVRKGYTFTGWYDDPVAGNEITAYGNTFAANPGTTYYYAHWVKDPEPTWPPAPGQPFSPDPNIPADEYPWDDPDHPFNWDEYLGDDPKIETPEPADVGKVMPADPDYKDLRITLSAKNEARTDGNTYVGDEVTYTILIENLSSPEKSWLDVIARADIPEGLKFMPGSIYLTTPTGEVIHVDDAAYNDLTRILALNVGDLAGGESAKVVFKAEVTIDALNKDIGMTSKAYGTLPSEFDVEDESYVKPEPGSAFVPAEGWNLYDLNHKSISNPEKVYPSENVTEQQHVLGTPDQQEQAKKLAKTGDTLGFIALGVGVIAVAAVITLLVALRRIRRDK